MNSTNTETRPFRNRAAAGRDLARAVERLEFPRPVIVLGLPRGGVPIAFEIASRLELPLDVLLVRKIGMPGQPELAIGAIAVGGVVVREPDGYVQMMDALPFERLVRNERKELERRERVYRSGLLPLDLKGKTVILADDGLATGTSMLAALRAARRMGASKLIVAAPVASDEAHALVAAEADAVVALKIPARLRSIGDWYEDFEQLEDSEVCQLLQQTRTVPPATARLR